MGRRWIRKSWQKHICHKSYHQCCYASIIMKDVGASQATWHLHRSPLCRSALWTGITRTCRGAGAGAKFQTPLA
ncbi:hypothetical protein Y1Q_0014801 [Alligator mississippiensis]|uniref:Uncharacterized protein n=1 Tax=Alligator mississippiensis TaxID=8496 RepID=A0A151M207_ALLMI|nr:hypothetical protein Y1Q_0014801 [Alligator mississippiensis]